MAETLVCGVDCSPGGELCNGYCRGEADAPGDATTTMMVGRRRRRFLSSLHQLERDFADLVKAAQAADPIAGVPTTADVAVLYREILAALGVSGHQSALAEIDALRKAATRGAQ